MFFSFGQSVSAAPFTSKPALRDIRYTELGVYGAESAHWGRNPSEGFRCWWICTVGFGVGHVRHCRLGPSAPGHGTIHCRLSEGREARNCISSRAKRGSAICSLAYHGTRHYRAFTSAMVLGFIPDRPFPTEVHVNAIRPKLPARILVVTIAICAASVSWSQTYPAKPLRMVVPFAPGGASDFAARIIAPRMSDALGQQIIIDNRAGAGGNVGMEVAARAAPDGYTMFFGNIGTLAINPHVYGRTLKVDPLKEFAAVSAVSETTNLLTVHPSVPVKSAKELIAFVKARPDQLNYASPGTGSLNHLQMELLRSLFGLKYVHVPYKGGAGPAVADVVAGHVTITLQTLTSAIPFVKVGRLRPLGVTAAQRVPFLPDVPTLNEQGVNLVSTSWQGMMSPAATPAELTNRLHAVITQSLNSPEVRERLATGAQELRLSKSPAEFGEFVRTESARWGKVVLAANVSLD